MLGRQADRPRHALPDFAEPALSVRNIVSSGAIWTPSARGYLVSFSHHVLFNAFKLFSKNYSASERASLFHDTAARAYRISEPG